ncbi:MAG: hypothetical protein RLY31_2822 [Bacteroidota bacterium]|jgi:endonuclease G
MQTALTSYLHQIESLISEDFLEDAFRLLIKTDEDFQTGLSNDLILQQTIFRRNEQDMMRGLLSPERHRSTRAQIRAALLYIVESLPRKINLNLFLSGVKGMNLRVPDDSSLEKIIGNKSRMVKIGWLEMALRATRSVGRVVNGGNTGTGFLIQDGYLITNNHVLCSAEEAENAYVEFNFEEDAAGQRKKRYQYRFDPDSFLTNDSDKLDYTRVKVLTKPEGVPLSEWGTLRLAPDAVPVPGDPVNIIQHPNGDVKQIALTANEVLGIWNSYVFYAADTEPGSSGSPVFNQSWQVVAVHHAGRLLSEGGMVINAKGEKRSANRGILIGAILEDIAIRTRAD